MGKELSINVSVKFDEERLQKAIEVFEQEVSECFSIEIGKKKDKSTEDNTVEPCKECGSINHTVSKIYADNNEDTPLYQIEECDVCGHTVELPTRLEGSE
ncbi:hypothetical protein MTP04_22520 [Lysinibacillus sp. PLM2]|nr:hypothetical protein MTP04_22520 [Lysinibacillus sp. PLM2]